MKTLQRIEKKLRVENLKNLVAIAKNFKSNQIKKEKFDILKDLLLREKTTTKNQHYESQYMESTYNSNRCKLYKK